MRVVMFVWLVVGLLCLSLPVVSLIYFINVHENAHVEINREYGLNSTVSYNYFGTSVTTPEGRTLTRDEELDRRFSQSEVEAFGYQIEPIVVLLSVLVSIVLFGLFYFMLRDVHE